jgi:hypothetical protein
MESRCEYYALIDLLLNILLFCMYADGSIINFTENGEYVYGKELNLVEV